jgi:GNAT superfamily N-acetyltransferase
MPHLCTPRPPLETPGQVVDWGMAFTTHPVTPSRFDDFGDVINPNRRTTHCWCLSHRLAAREIEELGQGSREDAARALSRRRNPPGVVAYDDDGTPVGWCSIGPRAENTRLSTSKLIRPLDDVPVWSIICVVVRGGHRKRGVTTPLLDGAVAYAASRGAPVVEAYPVDPPAGTRIDTTMAFVGTRAMFEKAGFAKVGETDAVASKLPRIVVRRDC